MPAYVTRSRLFMWLAFVFFVLASLVGGHVFTSSVLSIYWLIPGGLASMVLASLE